jgi:hypothetical protein
MIEYTYIHIYIYIYVCICICILYLYVYIYTYIYIYVSVSLLYHYLHQWVLPLVPGYMIRYMIEYAYIDLYTHIHISCICLYIWIYIHICVGFTFISLFTSVGASACSYVQQLKCCINDLNFCVHYLCNIGWVYVFYVGHVDGIDYMKPFSIL